MMLSGDEGERIKEKNVFWELFWTVQQTRLLEPERVDHSKAAKLSVKKQDDVLDLNTRGSGYLFERRLYDVVALNIGGSQLCKYCGHFLFWILKKTIKVKKSKRFWRSGNRIPWVLQKRSWISFRPVVLPPLQTAQPYSMIGRIVVRYFF